MIGRIMAIDIVRDNLTYSKENLDWNNLSLTFRKQISTVYRFYNNNDLCLHNVINVSIETGYNYAAKS